MGSGVLSVIRGLTILILFVIPLFQTSEVESVLDVENISLAQS